MAKRETRDEAINRADKATQEATRNWMALCRVMATDQRVEFSVADGLSVTVLYPPRAGASESSYVVVSVDRNTANIQVHPWDSIRDCIRYSFHHGTEEGHAMALALERAQTWIMRHMRGEV